MQDVRTATVTYGDVVKTFKIRLYTATELVGMLRSTGFATVQAWGSLDGQTLLSPESRLAIRAVR